MRCVEYRIERKRPPDTFPIPSAAPTWTRSSARPRRTRQIDATYGPPPTPPTPPPTADKRAAAAPPRMRELQDRLRQSQNSTRLNVPRVAAHDRQTPMLPALRDPRGNSVRLPLSNSPRAQNLTDLIKMVALPGTERIARAADRPHTPDCRTRGAARPDQELL